MKVSIITCHRAINYGAVLQAYSLSSYIKSLGHDVNVIDYYPDYMPGGSRPFLKKIIWRFVRCLDLIKGGYVFSRFINDNLILTKKTYRSLSELMDNPPIADVYITGSDQVWNFALDNGKDGSFFLEFVPLEKVKASYAASMAQNSLPEPYRSYFSKMLNSFKLISVREHSANDLLAEIGFDDVKTVLDPVYLLSAKQWKAFASKEKRQQNPYVLMYSFNCTKEIADYAWNLAKNSGKKLIVINTLFDDFRFKADKHIWQESPRKFVKLFEDSDAVVTNSFHGLSFSVIFKKEVHVFAKKTGGNSRLFDLMESLHVADCRKGKSINYEKVLEELNSQKEYSFSVIDQILNYAK